MASAMGIIVETVPSWCIQALSDGYAESNPAVVYREVFEDGSRGDVKTWHPLMRGGSPMNPDDEVLVEPSFVLLLRVLYQYMKRHEGSGGLPPERVPLFKWHPRGGYRSDPYWHLHLGSGDSGFAWDVKELALDTGRVDAALAAVVLKEAKSARKRTG